MTAKSLHLSPEKNNPDKGIETPSTTELAIRIQKLISEVERKAGGHSEQIMKMIKARVELLQRLPLEVQFVMVELYERFLDTFSTSGFISSVAGITALKPQPITEQTSAGNDTEFKIAA